MNKYQFFQSDREEKRLFFFNDSPYKIKECESVFLSAEDTEKVLKAFPITTPEALEDLRNSVKALPESTTVSNKALKEEKDKIKKNFTF